MKLDLYSKTMLTLIAFSLLLLCADNLYASWIPKANAAGGQWECWHLVDPKASMTETINATKLQPGSVFSLAIRTDATKGSVSDTFCGWVQ